MPSFEIEKFKNPEKEHSVIYTWVWNMPVTRKGIDERLEAYSKAGITGLYILPMPKNFRPNYMNTYLEPEYLSEEFFNLVEYALNRSKSYGMELWLYDEGGWPSGGACGNTLRQNPEAAETTLKKRSFAVSKNQTYSKPNDVFAVFDGKNRLSDNFVAESDIAVTEYYGEKSTEKHPNRIDATNKAVVDTFIENTYKAYYNYFEDKFGTDLTAFFTDEPPVLKNTVPKNLFEIFYKKYGYDLTDYLPFLLDSDLAVTDSECRARIDYARLLGELFYQSFCQNISIWCKEHNIKMAGHLDMDHIAGGGVYHAYFSQLHCISAFEIPGVDVIWQQIRYPYKNIKPVQEGVPFFPRLASSAAHQNGGNLALSESLAVYGDGITPDEMRYVLNYQAVRGINIFNLMLLSNSCERLSALVERPVFSPEKPGFYNLKHINEYYARLSYLLKLGTPVCNTALYNPCADYWANAEISNKAEEAYTCAGLELEKEKIPFDIIDDYAIMSADATADGLKMGNAVYSHIVLPECRFISKEIKAKISPYLSKGEPILETKSQNLRVMARKTDDGTLYFIFNEGYDTVSETLNINSKLLYRIDVASGEVYDCKKAEIELVCGDMAVFFATGSKIPTATLKTDYTLEIDGFNVTNVDRYNITRIGLTVSKVDFSEVDDAFSGEITYRTEFSLPATQKIADRFRITLTDTTVSARVILNGEQVATLGITPMTAIISGEMFKTDNIIEIIVANTPANEIVNNHSVIESFDKAEIGSYDDRCIEFEKRYYKAKLGKVFLEKFID